jgi:hypothetical protein
MKEPNRRNKPNKRDKPDELITDHEHGHEGKCQMPKKKIQIANGDELVGCIGLIGSIG